MDKEDKLKNLLKCFLEDDQPEKYRIIVESYKRHSNKIRIIYSYKKGIFSIRKESLAVVDVWDVLSYIFYL